METRKILTILVLRSELLRTVALVLALGSTASGAQYLTVNSEQVDSITVKQGRSCTVQVVSDDSAPYVDYVGFDNGAVLGTFSHLSTEPNAGDQAVVLEYDEPDFYGYYVSASGLPPNQPFPGVHFVFEYAAGQIGETDLKLYNYAMSSVEDSVHITVIPPDIGTTFTYQGRLLEDSNTANDFYDFEFRLYNSPDATLGVQLGSTVFVDDMSVVDGYFTAGLDFGSVYDGDSRWLEIAVRPYASSDPCDFVTLSPRQELTPTPHAIYAKTAGSGNDWMVSGSDMYAIPLGNVGIGTASPGQKLEVNGNIRLTSGGIVSGGSGNITIDPSEYVFIPSGDELYFQGPHFGKIWAGLTSMNIYSQDSPLKLYTGFGDVDIVLQPAGDVYADANVGIGTPSPSEKLDVSGNIHLTGEIKKDVTGGTMNRATPIAYAFINSDGTVASGTPNVSCTWDAGSAQYEITIDGEYYEDSLYVTVAATSRSPGVVEIRDSGSGTFYVRIYRVTTGSLEHWPFQFVTYKP
jgi:hypothetical protein